MINDGCGMTDKRENYILFIRYTIKILTQPERCSVSPAPYMMILHRAVQLLLAKVDCLSISSDVTSSEDLLQRGWGLSQTV